MTIVARQQRVCLFIADESLGFGIEPERHFDERPPLVERDAVGLKMFDHAARAIHQRHIPLDLLRILSAAKVWPSRYEMFPVWLSAAETGPSLTVSL